MASDPMLVGEAPLENAPVGELLRRLIEDTGHLIRTELRLARSEIRGNVAGMAGGATMLAAGGIFLLAALFTLLGAIVGWLTPLVGAGWAAFIVAVGAGIIGLVLLKIGQSRLSAASLAPDRTIASVRADAETLKGN